MNAGTARRPRRGARIAVAVLLVATVVVVALVLLSDRRVKAERERYAGHYVLAGSHGREYINLYGNGDYWVAANGLEGSVPEEWTVEDGRIFVPTRTLVTSSGLATGDEVAGCSFEIRGEKLVCAEGSLKGTYRKTADVP